MRELVLFAALSLVRFTSESSQSFMVDIDAPWVDARNEDVDSQIELQAINQKRVGYVTRDDARFIDWDFADVVDLRYENNEKLTI